MQKLYIFLLITYLLGGCSDCTDCEPFAEEPYLNIRFYNRVDSSTQVVVIDSINNNWAGDYAYFQDTTNSYQLPLTMHEDISNIILTFRDTSNYANFITHTMQVHYLREFVKRTDNYIVVQSNITSVTSNFPGPTNLLCNDSLTCISNNALYQIYR